VIREAFGGRAGPARDVIALNAGAAIFVGGGADDLGAGAERARDAIASGAATEVLESLIETTARLAGAAA
jgi:anthranilate phosphoribosyltransferase